MFKGYSRVKKEALINKINVEWKELYDNGVIENILPCSILNEKEKIK